ncbi:hypothetical protein PGTUg99_032075 [Puccinia graminis f. sp. tritici]|uniref:Uncharacterized protein n=1 Tax=Puccinia graminis f. sp. tritici TaxID=56615 RepID=A0A5B0RM14_PUCGR|nr:hypothetical protein PGTUg99_032075 [Puccinia graminis f. sp. tritici]
MDLEKLPVYQVIPPSELQEQDYLHAAHPSPPFESSTDRQARGTSQVSLPIQLQQPFPISETNRIFPSFGKPSAMLHSVS